MSEALSESNITDPLKYFISGGFGGASTIITGHPFDTIKVYLQTMPKPAPGEPPLFTGAFDCAKKIISEKGFLYLYKGMAAPLTGVVPIFSLSFFGFSLGKKLQQQSPRHELNPLQLLYAGAFSGFFTTSVMTPVERIKVLLQVQQLGGKTYDGPIDCAVKLLKEGGIRSLYKGTCATLARDVPASGVYFMSYTRMKQAFQDERQGEVSMLLSTVIAGGMSGIFYWIVAMPADVIKSRLQTAPEGTYPEGMRSVFKQLLAEEGPRGFYKGFVPVTLRAFPSNAACFLGFEICMRILNIVLPPEY